MTPGGLPEGLDTPLGAHGTTPSGGERQPLGVARAPVLPSTSRWRTRTARRPPTSPRLLGCRPAVIVTHRPAEFPGLPVAEVGAGSVARSGSDPGQRPM